MSTWDMLQTSVFEIGARDELDEARRKLGDEEPKNAEGERLAESNWQMVLTRARAAFGTLMRAENVSFLLGAGASKYAGGILLGQVPREIEDVVLSEVAEEVPRWVRCFYRAVNEVSPACGAPLRDEDVVARKRELSDAASFPANVEQVMSTLYRWSSVVPPSGALTLTTTEETVELSAGDLAKCIEVVKTAMVDACRLPRGREDADWHGCGAHLWW